VDLANSRHVRVFRFGGDPDCKHHHRCGDRRDFKTRRFPFLRARSDVSDTDAFSENPKPLRRFGELRTFSDGEPCSKPAPRPGLFLCCRATLRFTRRRPRASPRADHRPWAGAFSGRDRPSFLPRGALVDGHSEVMLKRSDPAGPVRGAAGAEADRRRAHHARVDPRPGEPESGCVAARADGPLRSRPWRSTDVLARQGPAAPRARCPQGTRDAADSSRAIRRLPRAADLPTLRCPDCTVLAQSFGTSLALAMGMITKTINLRSSTTWPSWKPSCLSR